MQSTPRASRRLGDILKAKNLVSEEDLARLIAQAPRGSRLGELILERGLVPKKDLISALEEITGCQYMDGRSISIDPGAVKLIPRAKAARYCALPVAREDRRLIVLMSDPQNLRVLDELRFVSGLAIAPCLGLRSEMLPAIEKHYNALERGTRPETATRTETQPSDSLGSIQPFIEQYDGSGMQFFSVNSSERVKAVAEEFAAEMRSETTPAVKLASAILAAAATKKASDIHIQPHDNCSTVRIRVDGLLRELTTVPNELQLALVSRFKILANMDIAERRVPQDGRFLVQFGPRRFDLRVSTLPTHDGEKVVMRLLDPTAARLDFATLGFSDDHSRIFRSVLSQPQGMVLLCGPTGAGKSTTLYAALNTLISPELNIVTVEDPVEFKIREISQVQINPKAGLTFAGCLRAILRQDPNVILVGEIRDSETAEIALQAAQTGHLVLSSLHTNDAPSAVTRLLDLKIPSYLIASSLSLVVAQRLVRRLCSCRREVAASEDYYRHMLSAGIQAAGETMYLPAGCAGCDNTGYRRRVAVYEMLAFNDEIRDAVRDGVGGKEIYAAARQAGLRTLREDALAKVRLGLTTLEEVARVVGLASEHSLPSAGPQRAAKSLGAPLPTHYIA